MTVSLGDPLAPQAGEWGGGKGREGRAGMKKSDSGLLRLVPVVGAAVVGEVAQVS